MNVERIEENKINSVISFRGEEMDVDALSAAMRLLNPSQKKRVRVSDLARNAFRHGLPLAMKSEMERLEKEEKQRKELERAKGFEPSTFTLAR
jgi:hypothetical protein